MTSQENRFLPHTKGFPQSRGRKPGSSRISSSQHILDLPKMQLGEKIQDKEPAGLSAAVGAGKPGRWVSSYISSVGVLSPELSCPGRSQWERTPGLQMGHRWGRPTEVAELPAQPVVASCKTGGPCWVAGRLGLALPETGAEVLGPLPSPRQALTRERLELTDPTTHGCSSGDLGSEVFLTCPRSTPVAKEVHRWPCLGGLGRGWFSPQARGLQHSWPSCPGVGGP